MRMVGRRALNTSPIIDESLPLLHPRRSTGDDNEQAEVTEGYHSSHLHFMSSRCMISGCRYNH